ncbi:MAG: lipoate--protein ligase [Erysipelothrix sp.]|nr:lipoate--protein ligase [Erysipelothrix sp.]
MRYIINHSTNPYFNLALDEYALRHVNVDEDFFILWQNEPSIIIGKNQTTLEEINQHYVDAHKIKVARRVSGGGAVYHDFGNLNFTFITKVDDPSKVNYKKYVQPVVDALASMGIQAEASGRNDVLVDGLKISGNAQRMANGKLMHHGTILFDVDIEAMVEALSVDPSKFKSKGSKSVRSRVTNIKDHLPPDTTLEMFWEKLHYYLSNKGQDREIILTNHDYDAINQRVKEQFETWEWNYGASPDFDYHHKTRFEGGTVDVSAKVDQGIIKQIRFNGDYLGLEDVADLESALIGVRYDKSSIKASLSRFDLRLFFGSITLENILDLMF